MSTAGEPAPAGPRWPTGIASEPGVNAVLRRIGAICGSTPFIAFVLTLLAWTPLGGPPGIGLDPSWQVALHLAAEGRIGFGDSLIFSYGPLGFIDIPMPTFGWSATLAALWTTGLRLGIAAATVWALRRAMPLIPAIAVAFFAVVALTTNPVVPLAFIVCAYVATAPDLQSTGRLTRPLFIYGGAAFCAIESMAKINEGVLILMMFVVALIVMPGRKWAEVGRATATFALTFLAFWFLMGGSFAGIFDYLRLSAAVISGYSEAMVIPGLDSWQAQALIASAITLATAAIAAWRLPISLLARIGFVVLVLIVCFGGWKQGFVREGPGHGALFFTWLIGPWVVIAARLRPVVIGVAGLGLAIFTLYASFDGEPGDPIPRAEQAFREAKLFANVDGARTELREQSLATQIAYYALPTDLEAQIGDAPVHMYPWEAELAWAYDLNWKPLPMFQTYAGFEPALDHANADAIASDEDAPQFILRHMAFATVPAPPYPPPTTAEADPGGTRASIDGRYGPYDTPAATLAMLCHYEPVSESASYQLLERTGNRCGEPVSLGSVDAPLGQAVAVPPAPGPDQFVIAEVHGAGASSLPERIRNIAYRGVLWHITLDGPATYLLVPGTAEDGLLMSAPEDTDFPAPWNLAPDTTTLAVTKDPGFLSPDRELRIDFYAVPVISSSTKASFSITGGLSTNG